MRLRLFFLLVTANQLFAQSDGKAVFRKIQDALGGADRLVQVRDFELRQCAAHLCDILTQSGPQIGS